MRIKLIMASLCLCVLTIGCGQDSTIDGSAINTKKPDEQIANFYQTGTDSNERSEVLIATVDFNLFDSTEDFVAELQALIKSKRYNEITEKYGLYFKTLFIRKCESELEKLRQIKNDKQKSDNPAFEELTRNRPPIEETISKKVNQLTQLKKAVITLDFYNNLRINNWMVDLKTLKYSYKIENVFKPIDPVNPDPIGKFAISDNKLCLSNYIVFIP